MTTFGSVCSGIEAASVAWNPLGWEAAWVAEIEPFPCRVLAHHYPTVPNLGDMTTIADKILAGTIPAPDILCGGTPCQAFSVAGLRNSLGDNRGQLSLEFCRIADAINTVRPERPCTVFWENVPGVLSTKDNAFGCFLGALAGEDCALVPPGGRWTNAGCVSGPSRTVAWRVLDAQYFGLAQRRKRVFVVASAGGIDPIKVLFESEGVRRDSAPSREAGKGFAADVAPSIGASGRGFDRAGETRGQDPVIAFHPTQDPTLTSFVPGVVCNDLSPTVVGGAPFARTGNERVECDALVAQPFEVPNCLTQRMHKGINTTVDEGQTPIISGMSVRRLTPTECERLQGFPDGYAAIPKAADGPRYKALGNSWAVPVVRWIGKRIQEQMQ